MPTTKMTARQFIAENWTWALEQAAAVLIARSLANKPPRSLDFQSVLVIESAALKILRADYEEGKK